MFPLVAVLAGLTFITSGKLSNEAIVTEFMGHSEKKWFTIGEGFINNT